MCVGVIIGKGVGVGYPRHAREGIFDKIFILNIQERLMSSSISTPTAISFSPFSWVFLESLLNI